MTILSDDNIKQISSAMLGVINKDGAVLAQYVQSEAQKFAQSIETIGILYANKQINQDEAAAQLDLQKSASQAVLTGVEGIGLILAGQAINAGLQVVADIVNKAIGIPLI